MTSLENLMISIMIGNLWPLWNVTFSKVMMNNCTKTERRYESVYCVARRELSPETKGDLFTGCRSWMRRFERKSNRNSTTWPDPVRLFVFSTWIPTLTALYRNNRCETSNSAALIFLQNGFSRFSVRQWPLFSLIKNTKSSCIWKAHDGTDFLLNRGKNGFYFSLLVEILIIVKTHLNLCTIMRQILSRKPTMPVPVDARSKS